MFSLLCLVLFTMVTSGTTQDVMCGTTNVSLSGLIITLFNVKNQTSGIILNQDTYSSVVTTDPTTIIIHGWMQTGSTPWILQMKDTYLNKTSASANIIIVDWSAYDTINYFSAVCAVPYVGSLIGDLIHNLTAIGLNLGTLQINGFSLGAHVAGAAGQRVFQLGKLKVNRINGLDAAGPKFDGNPISQRLDATDAVFVQGIHTNGNGFGYAADYGTIDFQVNYDILGCGFKQPGCPLNPGVPTGNSPLPYIFCNHVRAAAYYIESINSSKFLGVNCSNCNDFNGGMCSSNPKTIMGEMCPFDQSGVRFLNTNSMAPFAQG